MGVRSYYNVDIAEVRDVVALLDSSRLGSLRIVTFDEMPSLDRATVVHIDPRDMEPSREIRHAFAMACKQVAPDEISGKLELAVGEAISNAIRHASPRSIKCCFKVDERRVQFRVEDDGRGIAPRYLATLPVPGRNLKQSLGIGFYMMRVAFSTVLVATRVGRGTAIHLEYVFP